MEISEFWRDASPSWEDAFEDVTMAIDPDLPPEPGHQPSWSSRLRGTMDRGALKASEKNVTQDSSGDDGTGAGQDQHAEEIESNIRRPEAGGQLRLQNRRLLLTYRSHLDKAHWLAWFRRLCKRKRWIQGEALDGHPGNVLLAHEIGDAGVTPYNHTHVAIDMGAGHRINYRGSARIFDYGREDPDTASGGPIHPHIAVVTRSGKGGNTAWERIVRYVSKEDPALAQWRTWGLAVDDTAACVDKVWAAPTTAEALRGSTTQFSDVQGIIALWNNRPTAVPDFGTTLPCLPWHDIVFSLADYMRRRHDHRHVLWIYDTEGGLGKTAFCKRARLKYGRDCMLVTGMDSPRDASTIVQKAFNSGAWTGDVAIFDLARKNTTWEGLYQIMEQIKNGIMTATKYEGGEVGWPGVSALLVFANEPPMTYDGKGFRTLSMDRWRILELAPHPEPPIGLEPDWDAIACPVRDDPEALREIWHHWRPDTTVWIGPRNEPLERTLTRQERTAGITLTTRPPRRFQLGACSFFSRGYEPGGNGPGVELATHSRGRNPRASTDGPVRFNNPKRKRTAATRSRKSTRTLKRQHAFSTRADENGMRQGLASYVASFRPAAEDDDLGAISNDSVSLN